MLKKYNIFISHSWTYNDTYKDLLELLSSDKSFEFKDYSVPKDNRIHTNGTDKQLYEAIKNKIQPTSIVIVLAGVYSSYSKWIDKEMKIAKDEFSSPKPILAIEPWASERTSEKVKKNANKIVKWNTSSIVSAIKELCK